MNTQRIPRRDVGIPSITLTPATRSRVQRLVERFLQDGKPASIRDQLLLGRLIGGSLNTEAPELMQALRDLRPSGSLDAILFHGLPVDPAGAQNTPIGDLVSLALAGTVGVPFQYSPQPDDNRFIAQLTPKPGLESVANTGQGGGEFRPHTDFTIFAPTLSPRYLLLLSVWNTGATWTAYIPVDDLVSQLPDDAVQVLQQARFVVRAPDNVGTRTRLVSRPQPILWKENGLWHAGLPTHSVQPSQSDDRAAAEALAKIVALAEDPELAHRVVLETGSALFFNQHRGLHARGPVSGRRLILRTYVGLDDGPIRGMLTPDQLLPISQLV